MSDKMQSALNEINGGQLTVTLKPVAVLLGVDLEALRQTVRADKENGTNKSGIADFVIVSGSRIRVVVKELKKFLGV